MSKPKMLVHVCCAPCAAGPLKKLRSEFEVTAYFYNPNVLPREEYLRRAGEVRRLTQDLGIPLVEGVHDVAGWLGSVRGLEEHPQGGVRCQVCYELRLERAAEYAEEQGFEWLACTLTCSPLADAAAVNAIGRAVAERHGLKFYEADFSREVGPRERVKAGQQYGLEAQEYCGCVFSLRQRDWWKRARVE